MKTDLSPWAHFDACVKSAMRIVNDVDVARDIATQICADEAATDYGYVAPPPVAHLTMRARWRALDHTRKGQLEIVRGFDVERVASSMPTPEQALEEKQTRQSIAMRLRVDEMVVLERTAEGFSDADIAALLDKSEVAVRQMRSRARRKLINVGE